MPSTTTTRVVLLGALLVVGLVTLVPLQRDFHVRRMKAKDDILYIWNDGRSIAYGRNPYERIIGQNMQVNRKYPTYFPGFYLLVAAAARAGFDTFNEWMGLWRVAALGIHLATALVLADALLVRAGLGFALFGGLTFLLGRWSLYEVQVAHIDGLPILFLILSLTLWERRRNAALLLFGASLAVKQIAIFLTPLYLLWHAYDGSRRFVPARAAWAALMVGLLPGLLTIPFLVWNAEAYVRSVLFSATRNPGTQLAAPSLASHLGLVGLPGTTIMLAMMAMVYWLSATRRIGRATAALLVMSVFIDFNSVLFLQYLIWTVPLLLLALAERQEPAAEVPRAA